MDDITRTDYAAKPVARASILAGNAVGEFGRKGAPKAAVSVRLVSKS